MRLHVIGTFADVTGFALAGAAGTVCSTEAEVTAALQSACGDQQVALVLVSPEAAILAPRALRQWQATREIPIVIGLPGDEEPGPTRERPEQDDENTG